MLHSHEVTCFGIELCQTLVDVDFRFRFIVQADWAVPSSREAILAQNPLNQCLLAALPDAFCDLIEELADRALAMSDDAERVPLNFFWCAPLRKAKT